MGKLTVAFVKNAKPGRHGDGKGLCLVVKPSGGKSWVLRVQHGGKRQDIGLGSLDLSSRSPEERRASEKMSCGYTTISVPVPRGVLMQAIVEAMFVS
jgi:hypothetical protein